MAFYVVSVTPKDHRDKLARVYFTTTSMTVTFNYGVIYHTPLTLRAQLIHLQCPFHIKQAPFTQLHGTYSA